MKGAILQLARNCAYDFAKYNIRSNSVCAGTVETPISAEVRSPVWLFGVERVVWVVWVVCVAGDDAGWMVVGNVEGGSDVSCAGSLSFACCSDAAGSVLRGAVFLHCPQERAAHGWTFDHWQSLKTKDVMLGRVGHVREIANATLYFACDESSYCTGTHLMVDGGQTPCTVMPDAPEAGGAGSAGH
jgi:NAD(P)-dependent dehydrogenase (short-subunit alcohol dehydrogenase family)